MPPSVVGSIFVLPIGHYLSGSIEGGLYRHRIAPAGLNFWILTRRASKRLKIQIDIASDSKISILADDVSVRPAHAVRGLRSAVQKHWSQKLLEAPHQGRALRGLALDPSSKDMALILSCRTPLQITSWRALHSARLDVMPLRG